MLKYTKHKTPEQAYVVVMREASCVALDFLRDLEEHIDSTNDVRILNV